MAGIYPIRQNSPFQAHSEGIASYADKRFMGCAYAQ